MKVATAFYCSPNRLVPTIQMMAAPLFDIFDRTQQIAAYEQDPRLPRRPVLAMLAGLLLAGVSAVLCSLLAYSIWHERDVPASSGLYGVSLLFCFYVAGAYVFALAYELYDVPRALRLTIVLAVLGVLALGFMIAALMVIAFIKTGAWVGVSEQHGGKVIGALSYLGVGEEDDGPARAAPNPYFSLITCKSCDRQFHPVPPNAVCPWCDTAFLTA